MRLLAAAFVLGVLWLQQQPELPALRILPLAGALLLARSLVAAHRRGLRALLVIAIAALAGYGWAAWRAEARLAQALPVAMQGEDVAITGVVASLPQVGERGTRFVFHRESGPEGVPRVLLLSWYPQAATREREAAPPPALQAGQRWRLTVRLKRPRGLANPHGFDFEAWALERGVRATGYVRARQGSELVDARVEGWPYTLHRWRGGIREAMVARLGEARMGGVLVALAIGDQDSIAAADWDVFWRTGVGHLMSISGLHITMLAGLAFALARFAWVRVPGLALRIPARKAAIVAGVLAALAYSLLTGYAVPAQRTFCMLAAIALCVLADRHGSPSRVLALAGFAVVAIDPWAVLSAGFWLSFGAVASIFYVMALRHGRRAVLDTAWREQLAVTIAMVPMLLALFQQLSLVSPLANALAIPLVSLVVVPLTLLGAFLPLPGLLDLAHELMRLVMAALEWLAQWPGAMLESHAPRPWTVALALVGCAWLLAPRGVPLRSLGTLWLAPMFLVAPAPPAPGEAWVDVLDVGNGLAVVVRTNGHALAYDAGPAWGEDSDAGRRIVVPFLRGEGVRTLSGLVVSHADEDHAGGAISVADSRRPAWLLSPLAPAHALHARVPRSIACVAGLRWEWDGVAFTVLHPASRHSREDGNPALKFKENDRSCVLRVSTRAATMLLTGDIEARSEAQMLARNRAALRSDVLLVPHHGSRTSSSPGFLDAVAPRVALVSAGHRSRFGHPHETVVSRYRERAVALHRTDREGAIRVVLRAAAPGTFEVGSLPRRVRYWSEPRSPP